jgi:predicted dehydrogenase
MLRVGLIGTGGIARAHANGWRAAAAAGTGQITALCDVSAAGLSAFEEALGVSGLPRYGDWAALLAEAELDAVDICLPHHLHAPAVLAAAAAGKHILIEKPLCTTFAEAEQITEAVEGAGITLMCAHNQLFEAAIGEVRRRIDAGVIGTPQMVYSSDAFRIDRTVEQWGWRAPLATAGGGVLIDTGYHPTYRLLYLAGSAPVAVTAMCGKFHCPIEGEDVANVLVQFANGMQGQVHTSWAFGLMPGAWSYAVMGTGGMICGRGNEITQQAWGQSWQSETLPPADGFTGEVLHFCSRIAAGQPVLQSHVDGINVLKVILGAYQAVAQQRVIKF